MVGINFPTSRDVYVEVNGKRLAAVEGYKVRSVCDKKYIRSFWNVEPIGVLSGGVVHEIELSRVYLYNDQINNYRDFFELTSFNLVLIKPGKKVVYNDCQWIKIAESINAQNMMIEDATLISKNRRVFIA